MLQRRSSDNHNRNRNHNNSNSNSHNHSKNRQPRLSPNKQANKLATTIHLKLRVLLARRSSRLVNAPPYR